MPDWPIVKYKEEGMREGMQTLDSHLQRLVKSRKITQQAALEKANNKKLFGGGSV